MKYVIKNCPAYKGYCTNEFRHGQCSEISGCFLKRIVELCKRYQQRCQVCPTHDVCFECESVSGKQLSDEILSLLENEVVE